jgi:DNA-binding transcriptional MerR regulator
LSRQTGVKVPTIRYYEQVGLLTAPLRTEGKQRRYGAPDITRLNFIKHSRDLGFEVDDIRELLALSAQPEQPCDNADKITARHLAAVDQHLAAQRTSRRTCPHARQL